MERQRQHGREIQITALGRRELELNRLRVMLSQMARHERELDQIVMEAEAEGSRSSRQRSEAFHALSELAEVRGAMARIRERIAVLTGVDSAPLPPAA